MEPVRDDRGVMRVYYIPVIAILQLSQPCCISWSSADSRMISFSIRWLQWMNGEQLIVEREIRGDGLHLGFQGL